LVAATLQHLNLSLEILSSSDKNMARTNLRAAPVKKEEGW